MIKVLVFATFDITLLCGTLRDYLFVLLCFCFIVQIDLLQPYRVVKLATQGRQDDYNQWVTGYKVACSMDGANFNTVKDTDSGSDMVTTSIDLFVFSCRCLRYCHS